MDRTLVTSPRRPRSIFSTTHTSWNLRFQNKIKGRLKEAKIIFTQRSPMPRKLGRTSYEDISRQSDWSLLYIDRIYLINFAAGGGAGTVEAFACHPLDTIKTRMQLCRVVANAGPSLSFIGTTTSIVTHEGVFALYNGLSAVLLGMGPKIAIRFSSFEFYKSLFQKPDRAPQSHVLFLSGLAAGVTEAITVLNPMDVLKIRLQAQKAASAQISPNATAPVSARPSLSVVLKNMIEKEGVFALYRGVGLTAVRQGTTQAVNFTVYNILKDLLRKYQPDKDVLPSWQTMGIGLFAGASGPICNAPLDTVKTRVQSTTGKFSVSQVPGMIAVVAREEGVRALWRGITPRLLRVAPGQAVSFTVYEFLKGLLQKSG